MVAVSEWAGLALCLIGAGVISSLETALVGVTESRVHLAIERRQWGSRQLMYWLQSQLAYNSGYSLMLQPSI